MARKPSTERASRSERTFPSASMETTWGNPRPPFSESRFPCFSPSILVVTWQNSTKSFAKALNSSVESTRLSRSLQGGQSA